MDPFYLALILLAAGLFVVSIELFVPSAGLLGVVAAILIVAAISVGFTGGLGTGALIMLLSLASLFILFTFFVKIWPHTPLGKRILIGDIDKDDVMPNSSHYQKRSDEGLVGRIGIAKTKMLPSGIVLIDNEKFDAVSHGFAIEAGEAVKVVSVKEHRIYVEPFDGESADGDVPVRDQDILSQPIEDFGIDSLDD